MRARALHFWDVILTLVRRDFLGRYRNTAIGMLWALVSPLMYLAVFYVLFGHVLKLGIDRYASFVLIGVLSWGLTQQAILQAVTAITGNGNMLSQPGFPVAALPIVAVASNLVTFVITLPLLLIVMMAEGVRPSLFAVLVLPIMVVQFVLTLGVCYLVAGFNVVARDVQFIVPVVMQVGYYVTPIFYSLDKVPERFRTILSLNPMAIVVDSYRAVLLEGHAPNWLYLAGALAAGLVTLGLAVKYFRHASRSFLEDV
ncbi:ABC transporter permease [Phenylobacterium sp. LjRoot225]|uniref:ABC transporter permease n=1 Tax=Phenylobacterium sp. LjRoot225 TaxID=3342285 RepID=UPI003ECFC0E4